MRNEQHSWTNFWLFLIWVLLVGISIRVAHIKKTVDRAFPEQKVSETKIFQEKVNRGT